MACRLLASVSPYFDWYIGEHQFDIVSAAAHEHGYTFHAGSRILFVLLATIVIDNVAITTYVWNKTALAIHNSG